MLDRLAQIAPLSTWGLVLGATLIFVCGFVTFSHAKLVKQAYGETFDGLLAPGTLETMVRWTAVLLPAGLLLWGIALDWPIFLLATLGAVAGGSLLLEAIARVRG